jgi:phage terminase large subunit
MKLSNPQRTIADDPSRFKVTVAGRRFGKTYLSMREICYRARQPNQEIFYITTSYRAAKMILWKPLKRRLLDLRWASKINESELSILLKNGSTISLKGSEDPDKLRGVSLSYCVIDEAAECKLNELWGEIVRPALADQQGGALFIGTPKGKSNPFYDLYQFALERTNTDWAAFQYTTLDGGFVSPEEIQAAKQDMSERQFKQEFLATFETYENRVAWAFEREANVVERAEVDTSIIHVGMDFNRNPLVASIAVQTGDDLWAIDEIQIFGSNTDEMCDEIQNRYPSSKIFVYPDPSGGRQQTSSGGRSDHSILQNRGFVVKAPRKHDPVKDRINAINARFRAADGKNHLFISPNCKHTINSLDKHTFKEGTQVPDKDSGEDHMFDAISYMVAYMYPIRRTVATPTAQSWGHKLF